MTENELKLSLDERLASAASFVHGDVVADIGTDHAMLPISLLLDGKVKRAIASDINEGPLERARTNGGKYGVTDKIGFYLTDGLDGLPLADFAVTDIVICGMGGELIASILSASDYPKTAGVRLILQPMTHFADLRRYLAENGYRTIDESLTTNSGKLYECIAAEYDGVVRELTPAEAELGKANIDRGNTPLFERLVRSNYMAVMRRIEGLKKGGKTSPEDEALACEIKEIAERCGILL